ncbi:hypothetical protein D9757_000122 [Collybiopsis confluens]|uniref:Vacuolar ATPase assembly integral membrane protein VMA21 homolog n=1 Tax=Collybiopsis confluens TaxID=2823264 RepID=A0A8H5MGH8_9AGAR|nr:hypothetical protein D9757_000122 [Collybiopsis confluens]
MSEQIAIGKLQTNASNGTLFKLVVFSLSLGIVPLTSYFGSLYYIWDGNSTFAAITAIVAANVVLISYIILSILEDKQTQNTPTTPTESKKER